MVITDYSTIVHIVTIKVLTKLGPYGELIEFIQWRDLPFALRVKYDWYFKYRAALFQIKYPRYIVETFYSQEQAGPKQKIHAEENNRKNKITALKSKITKSLNKLEEFKKEYQYYQQNYSSLFPIEEQPEFKMYVRSIELAEQKIVQLKKELKTL